jgi:serine/threonine protein kinase/tetratricopeptide (TPR) repeat protein
MVLSEGPSGMSQHVFESDASAPNNKQDGAARGSPLQDLLRSLRGGEGVDVVPQLPEVGDELFGFRLCHELGRGAFARVYLAEQADLARRPVVLKVSGIKGNEPQTLAQLQHTHIVPIYSVHEDARTGLRAVCMPYFGGASLSQVLQALWQQTKEPASGHQLVHALETVQQRVPMSGGPDTRSPGQLEELGLPVDPARAEDVAPVKLWDRYGYIRTVVWIVARLAEALHHAHRRGVIHRDVKPSNILLAADGQPMLLDFNLSQQLHGGLAQAEATLGGTVAYMAPEHLQALVSHDPALARQVDHRADIYSLGMVLYEMLAGRSPFEQSASYSVLPILLQTMAVERGCTLPSLRGHRPDAPWSLESIARKCLDPDPAKRYQRADHFALDLHCYLENRTLRYAPELSRVEQLRKLLRRHPRLTSSGTVAAAAAALLLGLGTVTVGFREHLARTRAELFIIEAQNRKQAYEASTQRALCLINTTSDMPEHLRVGLALCEEALALYGVLVREDWQQQPAWQGLNAGEGQRLAEDTRELLSLLAWGRVQTARGDQAVLRQALALLDRAQAIEGLPPTRALWEDRALYLEQLGDAAGAKEARQMAQQLLPVSARDHYLLATSYSRNLRYAQAVTELNEALRLNPQHYWSSFQRGICYLELGKPALAAGDFGTCVGLWPDFAWGYFNRGVASDKLGDNGEALRDYTAAIERDPAFRPAYLNRGLAHLDLKDYPQALDDFQKVTELGGDDAAQHAGRGVALERLGKPQEADAAFQIALARTASDPGGTGARIRCVYGFAVSARLPEKARAAFDDILRVQPQHPQALYGCAMLLVEQGRQKDALAFFDRAIEAAPSFVEARRFRAVLQARRGQFTSASQDMNWCLEREPTSGPTLYATACVAARAVEQAADPVAAKATADQALAFLEKALDCGYGRAQMADDLDLTGIRQCPQFQRLRDQAARAPSRN